MHPMRAMSALKRYTPSPADGSVFTARQQKGARIKAASVHVALALQSRMSNGKSRDGRILCPSYAVVLGDT